MANRSSPLLTNMSNCRSAPKWSLRGRSSSVGAERSAGRGPGPGSYGVTAPDKTRCPRAPVAQFGTALRDPMTEAQKQMPGPGQYNSFPHGIGSSSTPKFGFGTSLRAGPAERSRSVGPGPGSYDIKLPSSSSKVAFTSRHGDRVKRSQVPGPGQYAQNVLVEKGPRFGFGTSLRPDLLKPSKVPGPGTYMQGNSMGQAGVSRKTAPAYSMKPRRTQMNTEAHQTPGPTLSYTQFG